MNTILLYGSCYGSARRYARALSEKTGIACRSYEKAPDLKDYGRILYIGGLYAGGVTGLSKTLKKLPADAPVKLAILTVGLADPKEPKNRENIRNSLKKQMPETLFRRAQIFYLRGGIDYSALNFKHKAMMKMMYHHLKKLPPEKQTAETKALLATYNQAVDFVDLNTLAPVIAELGL